MSDTKENKVIPINKYSIYELKNSIDTNIIEVIFLKEVFGN